VNLYGDVIGFGIQIVLIWFAFFLLNCAKTKGELKFKYMKKKQAEEEQTATCCCCSIDQAK
jgi:hypothetical protein